MKKIIGLVLFLFCAFSVSAQTNDDFQSFRKGLLDGFQTFRKSVLDGYADFLDTVWKDYESFAGRKRDTTPKPEIVPDVDTTPAPEPPADKPKIDLPEGGIPDMPLVDKPQAPKPTPAPKPVIPAAGPMTTFPFYGVTLKVPVLDCVEVSDITSHNIAKAWKKYDSEEMEKAINTLITMAESLGLNDWFTYEMVRDCVNSQSQGQNSVSKIVLQHFILLSMGFDVRLALQDKKPLLLIPSNEKIYGRSFVIIKGTNYYEYDVYGRANEGDGSIYTCDLPDDVDLGYAMEFTIMGGIKYGSGQSVNRTLKWNDIVVNASIDKGTMEMLRHYPQMEIPCYAVSNVVPSLRNSVVNQLRPHIQGLSEYDAVNKLLHFVQYAFDYATDQQQHGYEKSYFFEENFYYPKNDCEDRAIFFAYLVNRLLGLDVHLVQYPGHECTAVRFKDKSIQGHGYIYEGSTYIICDPTYIGADIGHCMPDFVNTKPLVQIWLGK